MPASKIRADYDALGQVARKFSQQAQATQQSLQKLKNNKGTLQGGDWIGEGAKRFYQEMDSQVLPAVQRLGSALDQGARVTKQISDLMKQAEHDAAQVFQLLGGAAAAALGAAAAAAAGAVGGALGAAASGVAAALQAEQAEAANRIMSHLDPRVRQIANQSPQLQGQLAALEQQRWRIRYGASGAGSTADRHNTIITIDPSLSVNEQAATLAHEAGHGTYAKPYHAPTQSMTRQQYIDLNSGESMRDEGVAQLNAASVRREIMAAGGPDVGMPGTQEAAYLRVYDDFQAGRITQSQAVDQMGTLMGNESTSNTNQNYNQYYQDWYANDWDTRIAPGRRSP